MNADRLLDGLDPSQQAAVAAAERPLRILAPAGSGKTRVLTRLIAHGVATERLQPDRVLAVTFTRKAAVELRERLGALGMPSEVAAGTFHSAAWSQLRQWWSDQGVNAPSLLTSRVAMLRRIARADGVRIADAPAEIEWASSRMIGPDRYPSEAERAGRRPAASADVVVRLYRSYEAAKRRKHVVDFDDILRMVVHTLDTQPERARALRWRLRHLFVDEFQDVNPLQFRLLESWLGESTDLCVVGDPDQAIYRWNGADAGFLTDFEAIFPGATTVRLDRNYRSSAGVLAVASSVLGSDSRPEVMADPGPVPEIHRFADGEEEARAIAVTIRDSRASGTPWGGHGVLVRTHSQAAVITQVLAASSIPFRVRGAAGSATRTERAEHLDALDGDTSLVTAVADWRADQVDGRGGPVVADLIRLGREFLAMQPDAHMEDFRTWTDALATDGPAGRSDQVDVATLHAAKGLEWDTVFLTGIEEGFLPTNRAETAGDLAEERRLLYVGITRARRRLVCTWAERRRFGQRSVTRRPSRWLAAIDETVIRLRDEDRPVPRPAIIDLRRPPVDPRERRLRERLVEWRTGTARRSGADPAAIVADEILDRIVEESPTEVDSLTGLGFGPSHTRLYGAQICRIVSETTGPTGHGPSRTDHPATDRSTAG